jgi:hypothetical protein
MNGFRATQGVHGRCPDARRDAKPGRQARGAFCESGERLRPTACCMPSWTDCHRVERSARVRAELALSLSTFGSPPAHPAALSVVGCSAREVAAEIGPHDSSGLEQLGCGRPRRRACELAMAVRKPTLDRRYASPPGPSLPIVVPAPKPDTLPPPMPKPEPAPGARGAIMKAPCSAPLVGYPVWRPHRGRLWPARSSAWHRWPVGDVNARCKRL